MIGSFFKQPFEQFPVAIDFAPALPTGTTVSSCVCAVQDLEDGTDQTAAILVSPTATISGAIASVTIKAGTAGHLYNLRFRATLNTGSILEEDATLSCQQDGH
jgi:hypothetical protein